MVCLVINGKKLPHSDKLLEALQGIKGMTTLVVNQNRKKTNAILGEEVEIIWGPGYITDYIGKRRFQISALSFYQINPAQTKVLYDKIVEFCGLTGAETVFDLYCGIGTISLYLAEYAKKVVGVEVVPSAIEDAKKNAELNEVENAEFFCGEAEKIVPELYEKKGARGDVVVVDPPRKGCDAELLDCLISMKAGRIVYVSCDPATLARDLKVLTDGGYRAERIQPVDMFGMSYHVETVVQLSLNKD